MASTRGGRFRELIRKYGKVALGVHFSVSAASITGLYVAIKNNVDVESIIEKFNMGVVFDQDNQKPSLSASAGSDDASFLSEDKPTSLVMVQDKEGMRNRMTQLAASAGGAFTIAVLCNKALFPIRVPITIALTPPIARFLARRNIIKTDI